MFIASQYSKSFYSHGLNREKYDTLLTHAQKINKIKNLISVDISRKLEFYLPKSKFDTIKLFEKQYSGQLPSADLKCLIEENFDAYQNKFDAIKRKLEFKKVEKVNIEFYKRNTKQNKKGDIKKVEPVYVTSNLSLALTYLIKYGFAETVPYIQEKLKTAEPKMVKVYQNVLDQITKFGFDRLCKLCTEKKNRVYEQYSTPINFKSLSFKGNNRIKQPIITFNKNYNSVINSFITLGNIEEYKKLDIPIKYSKDYHNEMKKYSKGLNSSYVVCFTNKPNEVRIVLSYEDDRYIPDNKINYMGVDVNMKRNMFSTSEEFTVDYNRKLLNKYAEELIKLDKLKENKEHIIGSCKLRKLENLKRKVEHDIEQKCVELIKKGKALGKDHLVMENLTGFKNKTYGKDKETELKIARLSRELQISSHKDKVESIGRKYDVAVSTVQPHYTSQQCCKCGCIDDENRVSQAEFVCTSCKTKADADFNSPKNIVYRVTSNVLRDKLLKEKFVGSKIFEPLNLKKDKIKVILSMYGCSSEYKTL